MDEYVYSECGLDNVIIRGMLTQIDDMGDEVYCIPNVNVLHRTIAEAIIKHQSSISGKELRFLRTEIGLTQAEMAKFVHVDTQTVGRWERGETPIQPAAEALIRKLIAEKLELDDDGSIDEIAGRCTPSAQTQMINIDHYDGGSYRLVA